MEINTTRDTLLRSLESSIGLMAQSKEDGAVFLLEALSEGVGMMHRTGMLSTPEAAAWQQRVLQEFQAAHPQLAAQLAAGEPLHSDWMATLLEENPGANDLVERVRAILREFTERGLRKPH
jgi:hypothetical protein